MFVKKNCYKQIINFFNNEIFSTLVSLSFLIYGGAGSGKTFTINAIMHMLLCKKVWDKRTTIYTSNVMNTFCKEGIKFCISKLRDNKKRGIIIIKSIHTISLLSYSFLLKIMEEHYQLRIFITSYTIKMLPYTLLSRCIKIHLISKNYTQFSKIIGRLVRANWHFLYNINSFDINSCINISMLSNTDMLKLPCYYIHSLIIKNKYDANFIFYFVNKIYIRCLYKGILSKILMKIFFQEIQFLQYVFASHKVLFFQKYVVALLQYTLKKM